MNDNTILCKLMEAMYMESEAMTRTARKFGDTDTWGDALSNRLNGIVTAAIHLDVSREDRIKLVELMNRLNKRFVEDSKY